MSDPSVIRITIPDSRQAEDMQALTELCRQRDHIHSSCPLDPEEGACHFLLYDKEETMSSFPALLGIFSVIPYEDATAECIAFTHPDYRRKGIFSALLSRVLKEFDDYDLLFAVSEHCHDALAALDAIGAEFQSEELQMELELLPESSFTDSYHHPDFLLTSSQDALSELTEWNLYDSAEPSALLGTCQTSMAGSHCVCLHHVEVPEKLRGNGFGSVLMKVLLDRLTHSGIRLVILQVSGNNKPALALYRKQGFRVTETLSFYLY